MKFYHVLSACVVGVSLISAGCGASMYDNNTAAGRVTNNVTRATRRAADNIGGTVNRTTDYFAGNITGRNTTGNNTLGIDGNRYGTRDANFNTYSNRARNAGINDFEAYTADSDVGYYNNRALDNGNIISKRITTNTSTLNNNINNKTASPSLVTATPAALRSGGTAAVRSGRGSAANLTKATETPSGKRTSANLTKNTTARSGKTVTARSGKSRTVSSGRNTGVIRSASPAPSQTVSPAASPTVSKAPSQAVSPVPSKKGVSITNNVKGTNVRESTVASRSSARRARGANSTRIGTTEGTRVVTGASAASRARSADTRINRGSYVDINDTMNRANSLGTTDGNFRNNGLDRAGTHYRTINTSGVDIGVRQADLDKNALTGGTINTGNVVENSTMRRVAM